jgi:hypothetical protein
MPEILFQKLECLRKFRSRCKMGKGKGNAAHDRSL